MTSFVYTPLAEGEVRLLRIDSAEGTTLSYSLTHYPLQSAPPYAAISYCWGSCPSSKKIDLDGQNLSVAASLYDALQAAHRFLSEPDEFEPNRAGLLIWADAVCINQDDCAEKAVQVPCMGRIYGGASRVLAWLGEERAGSAAVLSAMKWVSEASLQEQFVEDATEEERADEGYWAVRDARRRRLMSLERELESNYGIKRGNLEAIKALVDEIVGMHWAKKASRESVQRILRRDLYREFLFHPDDLFWSAFLSLIYRDWFSRVWTYQEILLAQKASVLCGDRSVGFEAFDYFRLYLNQAYCFDTIYNFDAIVPHLSRYFHTSKNRDLQVALDGGHRAFRELLQSVYARTASDPRDYVYGLLGLVGESIRLAIIIDYSKEPSSVYVNAMSVACNATGGAKYLCKMLEDVALTPKETPNLPSWCPDLSYKVHNSDGAFFSAPSESKFFWDGWDEKGQLAIDDNSGILSIDGAYVDTIKSAATSAPSTERLNSLHGGTYNGEKFQQGLFELYCGKRQQGWLTDMRTFFSSDEVTANLIDRWLHSFFFSGSPGTSDELRSKFDGIIQFSENVNRHGVRTWHQAEKMLQISYEECAWLKETLCQAIWLNRGRYFFITKTNKIGFTPVAVHPGDQLWFLPGGRSMHVLSSAATKYITCAYLEGCIGDVLSDLLEDWDTQKCRLSLT